MRVIILRGAGESGKSTTLNLVFDELTNSRYIRAISYKTDIGNPINRDFEAEAILTDHRVVAFYTMGDYDKKYIVRAINNFASKNVDVLIIASNEDKHAHFNHLIENFPNNIVFKSIADPISELNNTISNFRDCGTILSLL